MFKHKILVSGLVFGMLAMVLPMFAQGAATSATTINCIKSAVVVRETALGLAVADYTRSVGIAYSDRAVALQSAYSQTGDQAIKSAIKSSWTNFNTFLKSVKNKWSMAKNSAWSTYRSSIKTCKAPVGISDSSNSYSELVGS